MQRIGIAILSYVRMVVRIYESFVCPSFVSVFIGVFAVFYSLLPLGAEWVKRV